jgi:hypothetical protein
MNNDLGGNDMLMPLNIRRSFEGPDKFDEVCTSDEFSNAVSDFTERGQIANLAAHGWDVVLIDDYIFVGLAIVGYDHCFFIDKSGTKHPLLKEQYNLFYPVDERGNQKDLQLSHLGTEGVKFDKIEKIMGTFLFSMNIAFDYYNMNPTIEYDMKKRFLRARCRGMRALLKDTL